MSADSDSTAGSAGWQSTYATPPPDLTWVEVLERDNTVQRARAVYGRDGVLPHWQIVGGAVCDVNRFQQWRPAEDPPSVTAALVQRDDRMQIKASDDDVPISPDWLEAIGFRQDRPCHVWGTENCNWRHAELQLEVWQFNDSDVWLWVEHDRVEMRTRQHLRLLMAWLALRLSG